MGSLDYMFSMVPRFSGELIPKGKEKDSWVHIKRFMNMMDSMTNKELDSLDPKLMTKLRIMRVTHGCGHQVKEVVVMLK